MQNFFIIILLIFTNAYAFKADCTVYSTTDLYPSKDLSHPIKFSIVTGKKKLFLYHNSSKNSARSFFFRNKESNGDFVYTTYQDQCDYIEIILGKIKNDKLEFLGYFSNGDSELGTCILRHSK